MVCLAQSTAYAKAQRSEKQKLSTALIQCTPKTGRERRRLSECLVTKIV